MNPSPDRPITTFADDKLDRESFVDSLVSALVTPSLDKTGQKIGMRATSLVVGLTGEWGLGKSSVLHLVQGKLDAQEEILVAYFNPWLFNGRDELVVAFFQTINAALGKSNSEKVRAVAEAAKRYWGTISLAAYAAAALIDAYGAHGLATTKVANLLPIVKDAIPTTDASSPDESRRSLEEKIRKSDHAIVVLIDELDRVEDDEVRAVAQLIKAIGDISGISYLVAYEPNRVAEALGNRDISRGELYIEKIIHHSIPLRPLFEADKRALIEAAFEKTPINIGSPRLDYQEQLLDLVIDAIRTPRDINRLLGAFMVLENAVRGDICPFDVLGYCWIMTKSSTIQRTIINHIDDLVDDPSEKWYLTKRFTQETRSSPTDLVRIFGDESKGHHEILKHIFLKLQGKSTINGSRLSKRRNLVRMLYLGNPPDQVSRKEIERLWSISDIPKVASELARIRDANRLQACFDSLDAHLPGLPAEHDRSFWCGISCLLYRTSDWITAQEGGRHFVEQAAAILSTMAQLDQSGKTRLIATIHALIECGDLSIVPYILYKEAFAHGLTDQRQQPRGNGLLTEDEARALMADELPRYRNAVFEGVALRRVPNPAVFYLLGLCAGKDDELRNSLTKQLSEDKSLITMAALLTPTGHILDRAFLSRLFSVTDVRSAVENLLSSERSPEDEWLRQSLENFLTCSAQPEGQNIPH